MATLKPRRFVFFFSLFLISIILLYSSSSLKASPVPSPSSSSSATMKLHPNPRRSSRRHSSRREFEAGDHAVPSGPNPISNRVAGRRRGEEVILSYQQSFAAVIFDT
nr:CLAVATA3/ESR (CLE)-related protein 41-like [Ipomoea batatas]GMD15574.1 CLAVATA3/ESR (CLE)-related protein 41-like [Ipomoea batatas]